MVSSVTTLGYIVMTILHHWPWGWRTTFRKEILIYISSTRRHIDLRNFLTEIPAKFNPKYAQKIFHRKRLTICVVL